LEKQESVSEVHIYLGVDKSATPANSSIHSYYKRIWEHLKLFQYRCFIHCQLPIYKDKTTGKLSKAQVNFSRDYSRFTLLYEQEVMRLMKIHHCFSTVARNLGIRIQRVEAIYHHYTQAFETDLLMAPPVNIAFDETSTRRSSLYYYFCGLR
jgi:transposase